MNIRRIQVLLFIALFLFSAITLNARERDITKLTLDNGLTVIIEEDHSAPVAALQMWVKTGSADETGKEEFGIAHVFEHMLFKGTKKRGVGEIAKEVEASGGNINAFTSYDNTVYHIEAASRYFPATLDILSDAIQNSAFDPVELNKELEVVLEEIRMGEDSPGRKIYKELLSTAYSTHPYKRPVIGFEDTVKNFKRASILNFFKRWYIPNNMTLVVTGDVDKTKAVTLIKESFKNFKKGKNPHKPRPVEPAQTSLKTVIVAQPINETHMALGFHIPEFKHVDIYALDIISSVLSEGVTSRLYKKLKIENEFTSSVSAYAMTTKEPGIFIISASLDADKINKSTEAIIEEVKKLGHEGPTPRELEKAKLSLEASFVYSRESMAGKAEQLGYYQTIAGDVNFENKYLDGIKKVGSDEVKNAVKKYLTTSNMTAAVILAQKDKELVTENGLRDAIKNADEKTESLYAGKIEAEKLTKTLLPGSITLIVKEDHSNPTVAFYAAFPGGLRFEAPETNGIGNFTASMLTRGTTKKTRDELARDIEDISGSVSPFSAKNSTGVSASFLSRFFDKGLDVFADVIKNPSFPEDEMEKLRKDILSAIKREEDYLPGYTFKLLNKELFKTHPYAMTVNGTQETVTAIKRDDLVKHYETVFAPERMIITVVGDVDTAYAIESVKEALKDFTGAGGNKPLPALSAPSLPDGVTATGDVKKKEQVNVGIGFLGPAITSGDVYAMSVLAEVLSSQGGRLFVELRDKLSLAYAVSAFTRPGVDTGMFAVYIGSAPQKKDKAIEGILRELKKITVEKVTEEELKRAKSALIGGYELGLQEPSSQASDMANNELLGLGYGHYKKYAEKIENVTAGDVLNAAKKYVTLDNYVISIVGPDMNPLKREN